MNTAQLIAGLIAQLALLTVKAIQAEQAGDQMTLDAIQAQAVATSNALAPPGDEPAVAIN